MPGVEISGLGGGEGGQGAASAIVPILRASDRLLFLGIDGTLYGGSDAYKPYDLGAYLGYRERIGDRVVGGWVGADTLRTVNGNVFQRLIAGVESYGPRLILRANGFVPLNNGANLPSVVTSSSQLDETVSQSTDLTSSGTLNDVVTTTDVTTTTVNTYLYKEYIPSGIDAEIGLRQDLKSMDRLLGLSELRVFAGTYRYFDLKEDHGDVSGVRARLELDSYPFAARQDVRLSLESEYSYDDYRHDQWHAGLRLGIPLGGGEHVASIYRSGSLKDDPVPQAQPSSSKDLYQPVRRNTDPVSVRRLVGHTTTTGVDTKTTTQTTPIQTCGGMSVPLTVYDAGGVPMNVAPHLGSPPIYITYTGAPYGSQQKSLADLGITPSSLTSSLQNAAAQGSSSLPVTIALNSQYGGSYSGGGSFSSYLNGFFTVSITSVVITSSGCRLVGSSNQQDYEAIP